MRLPRPHGRDRRAARGRPRQERNRRVCRRTRPHAPRHHGGHTRGDPRRGAPRIMRLPIPTGSTDGPARATPPRSCRHGSPPTTAPRAARHAPSARPISRSWPHGSPDACHHPLSLRNPANVQLSAAPLAGVWSVEDNGKRQLPGNARAADPWNEGGVRMSQPSEGCGWSLRQQAGAFCRVNRAQPTSRASGVSCTARLGGPLYSFKGKTPLIRDEYNIVAHRLCPCTSSFTQIQSIKPSIYYAGLRAIKSLEAVMTIATCSAVYSVYLP